MNSAIASETNCAEASHNVIPIECRKRGSVKAAEKFAKLFHAIVSICPYSTSQNIAPNESAIGKTLKITNPTSGKSAPHSPMIASALIFFLGLNDRSRNSPSRESSFADSLTRSFKTYLLLITIFFFASAVSAFAFTSPINELSVFVPKRTSLFKTFAQAVTHSPSSK